MRIKSRNMETRSSKVASEQYLFRANNVEGTKLFLWREKRRVAQLGTVIQPKVVRSKWRSPAPIVCDLWGLIACFPLPDVRACM